MERFAKALELVGLVVLAIPVWKAGRIGRLQERVRRSEIGDGSNHAFERARRTLERRLRPNEWTRTDQNILYLGYGITFCAQLLGILS